MYVKRVAGAAFAAALGMSGLAVGAGVAGAAPLKPPPTYTGFGPIADAPPGPARTRSWARPRRTRSWRARGIGWSSWAWWPRWSWCPRRAVLAGPGGPGGSGGAHGPGGRGASGWPCVVHLADQVEDLGPVDRELPDPMGRVDLGDLASRVAMGPVGLAAPVDLGQTGRAAPADRVELTSRVDRVAPVVLAAPAVPDLTGRVDLAGRAAPVDRHRRRTSNTVSTTGVAPRWAAPGTCRTGSARRITGRRLRPGNTDSAGTVGLPPVLRRLSGTDHHLQVAGAGLRLPVVGTAHGTGRRAMSQSRSVISGRLVTTGTTRSRCSTRYSVDGASGSSVSGSRCTDLTARSPD